MLGKNLDITPTEALFLLVLHNSESLAGYEIVNRLQESLGEDWSPSTGATYKIIQSLVEKGLIEEKTEDDPNIRTTKDGIKDQRIKTYKLTSKGSSMVLKITSRMSRVLVFIESCCPDATDFKIVVKKC